MAKATNPSNDSLKSEILSSIRDEADGKVSDASGSSIYYREPEYSREGYTRKVHKYTRDGYTRSDNYARKT